MLSNEEHMSKLDTSPHDYTSLVPGKGKFVEFWKQLET